MKRQFSEILQSSFSIVAFLGIIVLSSFVVLNLNPVAVLENSQMPGPRVAGVSTDIQSLNFINTASESEIYKTKLEKTPELITYKASFKRADSKVEDSFIKIQNPTQSSTGFTIKAIVPTKLNKIIKISITDSEDLIYLNNLEPRRISLNPSSERSFKISYTLSQPVNFSFDIDYEISD